MNHLEQDEMTQAYYDGREPQHLADCAACREAYAQLAQVLDAIKDVPVPEPGPEFEQRLWAKMEPAVRHTLAPRSRWRWAILAPLAASLLAGAFIAGMYTQRHDDDKRAFSATARQRSLLIALANYLDRSQIVLSEVANAPDGGDIAGERHTAEDLLSENRLLRLSAEKSGDPARAQLLDELERALIEIAHSPSDPSAPELESLRNRIETQGLLFKVRVVGSNVRQKGMTL